MVSGRALSPIWVIDSRVYASCTHEAFIALVRDETCGIFLSMRSSSECSKGSVPASHLCLFQ